MYPPSRKDFISLTLSDPHNHTYNNGKHRRQSCWRKWKQLSRLQRSLILFLLALLLIFGLLSYPSITQQWRGWSDRDDWLELNDRDVKDFPLDVQSILDQAAGKALPPAAGPHVLPAVDPDAGAGAVVEPDLGAGAVVEPDLGAGAMVEPRGPNIPIFPKPPTKIKTFPNKRGPPSLQKDGNISDTVGGEKQVQEVVREEEGEEEDKEKKIVSWRGAIIEADQATEPPPSANEKEAAAPPADPAATVPPEGLFTT